MKKLYTLIILAVCNFVAEAQTNFSSITPDLSISGNPGDFTFEGRIELVNNTFGDITMGYELLEESVPMGWQTSNCLGTNCLPIGMTSGTFNLAVMSPDNYVIGHFYPNNIAGTGFMRIKIYEVFNPTSSIILTYYGSAGVVSGVQELKDEDVHVFPNPTSDVINVILPNDDNVDVKIEIIDALGRVVKSKISTQSNTKIDIYDLNTGVYFVATGSVRKKIIKKE